MRPISYFYPLLVKKVAQGCPAKDAEEAARGLRSIRPNEKFRTSLFGSSWLWYFILISYYWAPFTIERVLAQTNDVKWIPDYELALAEGVRALNVWKVCKRNAGIVYAFPKREQIVIKEAEQTINIPTVAIAAAAMLLVAVSLHAAPYHSGHVSFAAITSFYMQTTGSDVNAGSSTANAADVTSTNGNWNSGTSVFTAAAGTPFSAVTTNDWASIYLDGSTQTTYVAKVTAIGGGGANITLSTTNKIGTAPTTGATGRTCKINGAHASLKAWDTNGLSTGATTIGFSLKVNIKNGTYSSPDVGNGNFTSKGQETTIYWFSGYNTTPGDLDNDLTNALAKPIFTVVATGAVSYANHQFWSSLTFNGNANQAILGSAVNNTRVIRCRYTNSNAGVNASAIATTGATCAYTYGQSPTTCTNHGVFLVNSARNPLIGCLAVGGGLASYEVTQYGPFIQCVALNPTGIGFSMSPNEASTVVNCTVAGATGDGMSWTAGVSTSPTTIVGCLFTSLGGWGLNNTGTATDDILRLCNDYYSCALGNENGFQDTPSWFQVTESSNPIISSTNFTLKGNANGKGKGFPGVFENSIVVNFPSVGGSTTQVPGSTGFFIP